MQSNVLSLIRNALTLALAISLLSTIAFIIAAASTQYWFSIAVCLFPIFFLIFLRAGIRNLPNSKVLLIVFVIIQIIYSIYFVIMSIGFAVVLGQYWNLCWSSDADCKEVDGDHICWNSDKDEWDKCNLSENNTYLAFVAAGIGIAASVFSCILYPYVLIIIQKSPSQYQMQQPLVFGQQPIQINQGVPVQGVIIPGNVVYQQQYQQFQQPVQNPHQQPQNIQPYPQPQNIQTYPQPQIQQAQQQNQIPYYELNQQQVPLPQNQQQAYPLSDINYPKVPNNS